MKFTPKGELLLKLGIKGKAGEDSQTFNKPTDIAWAPNGDFYVSDGYGNSRVVKFTKDGKYIKAWGKPGKGPGEFKLPHSVAVDSKGLVYVSDRGNNRIQIFDGDGNFLRQWTNLGSTQNLFITPSQELWAITYRDANEIITYDTLSGRIMKVDPATGKSARWRVRDTGSMCPWNGDIYIGSLTGNVFKWSPGWV